MQNKYTRPLKVSNTKGERVFVTVYPQKEIVRFEIKYYEEVKKDKPPFSKDGVIKFTGLKSEYRKTINLLTRYFENLFLKGMADEDFHTSIGIDLNSRRIKKENKSGKIETTGGTGSPSSIHSGTRGEKPTEGSGGRKSNSEMDKSGNTSIIGKN